MVDRVCPVCGEHDDDYCQVVIGEQHGEPVVCGAVEAIHGDALGMVRGHAFRGVTDSNTWRHPTESKELHQ